MNFVEKEKIFRSTSHSVLGQKWKKKSLWLFIKELQMSALIVLCGTPIYLLEQTPWNCWRHNLPERVVTQDFAEPGAWLEARPYLVKNLLLSLQIKEQVSITSYVKIYSLLYLFCTRVHWKTVSDSVFKFFPNLSIFLIEKARRMMQCWISSH